MIRDVASYMFGVGYERRDRGNIYMLDNGVEIIRGRNVPRDPRISVIIPAYNVSQYIKEALDSVFVQTFRDFEVVVVNDGSPDTKQLEEVLTPFWDRITYARQENRGLSGARNTGLRLTRAPYVALLDSDDAWLPDYLAVQMAIIEGDPTIDVLYPNSIIFGQTSDAGKTHMDLNPSDGEVTIESLVLQKCNVMVSVTAKRDTMIRAGMFDENLRSSEDFDLWLRIVNQGGKIAYHRRVLVRYRRRDDSLSSDTVRMYEHIFRVLRKAEQSLHLTEWEQNAIQKAFERFNANFELYEGKKALSEGDAYSAIKKFKSANLVLKSTKIAVVVWAMGIAPTLLLRTYVFFNRSGSELGTRS